MVIGNDVLDAPSACIVDEVNANEIEFPMEIDVVVHLGQKSCTCCKFDINKIPWAHALTAMENKDFERVAQLCSEFYKVDTWMLAYSEIIYPVPAMS